MTMTLYMPPFKRLAGEGAAHITLTDYTQTSENK